MYIWTRGYPERHTLDKVWKIFCLIQNFNLFVFGPQHEICITLQCFGFVLLLLLIIWDSTCAFFCSCTSSVPDGRILLCDALLCPQPLPPLHWPPGAAPQPLPLLYRLPGAAQQLPLLLRPPLHQAPLPGQVWQPLWWCLAVCKFFFWNTADFDSPFIPKLINLQCSH